MWASRKVEICNQRGLHARAAAKFVKLSDTFDADVLVTKDENKVGGTSIMGLMMLAACKGSTIEISASGADAELALAGLCELVANKFDEEC